MTSALDGDEWSVSRPGRFTPSESVPSTHWIGNQSGYGGEEKNSQPLPGLEPPNTMMN